MNICIDGISREMTMEEISEAYNDTEVTEEDYQNALCEMGVEIL